MNPVVRRRAREMALQVLYQMDLQDQLSSAQAIELYLHHLESESEGGEVVDRKECESYATKIVDGVREHRAELDEELTRASRNWRLERMACVDRNLLRLALYELKYAADVPHKVAINEAIEISKRFGTSESPAFINGILDRCLFELSAAQK